MRRPFAELTALLATATLLCALYAAMLLLPASSESSVGGARIIQTNACRGLLYLLTLGIALAAVVLAIWTARREERRPLWSLLALGLASPAFLCFGAFNDAGAFYSAGFVLGPDGKEYHLLKSSFLQGAELAIGRLRHRMGPFEEFEALVASPWEEGFGYLAVVRPEGSPKDREVWLTTDGKVVGVPSDNKAFLAYDLHERKTYSQIYNANVSGYTDIRELSPLLLLGPTDSPRKSDYQVLLDAKSTGRPFPGALGRDLESQYPRVRQLAEQLWSDLRAHPSQE